MTDPYRFLLRMPCELKEPLRRAAEENGRSLNAEIVARLEGSVGATSARRAVPARLAAAVGIAAAVALGGLSGYVVEGAVGPSRESSAKGPPLAKRALLGDPIGSPARLR